MKIFPYISGNIDRVLLPQLGHIRVGLYTMQVRKGGSRLNFCANVVNSFDVNENKPKGESPIPVPHLKNKKPQPHCYSDS